jgi:hypothetical protein
MPHSTIINSRWPEVISIFLWEKPSRRSYQQKLKKGNGSGSGEDIHVENLLAKSQEQHWNGIHRKLEKKGHPRTAFPNLWSATMGEVVRR